MKLEARSWQKFARRRIQPGASPGTLAVDPQAPPPRLRLVAYGPDELHEEEIADPEALRAWRGRLPVVWVNVDGLGDVELLARLGAVFGLHQLALEDVVHVPQRPKLEAYGDQLFVVLRQSRSHGQLDTEQFSLFLGPGFVLSFQEREGDSLEPVRERLRKGRPRMRNGGPDYLAYSILDAVVDGFFPLLEGYGGQLEELEEEVLSNPEADVVSRLHLVKHDLVSLRRYAWPMRDALGALSREDSPLLEEGTRLFLRDCHDHAVQFLDLVETYRDVSSGLIDLYLSSISNRMNEVMKVLTIIATVFIPLGFIAGLYGMNFNTELSPWNLPELNWRFGYPFALGVMAATAVVMLIYFRRKGWLGGGRRRDGRRG
ncbi:MAG: magnesium/cobalt transporter CorA [Candidatus Krumholzibacteriota bacterium]|nr:magnesium/cobalt transporter CorA [Candidatus Krumholzibacteriota bacterium]